MNASERRLVEAIREGNDTATRQGSTYNLKVGTLLSIIDRSEQLAAQELSKHELQVIDEARRLYDFSNLPYNPGGDTTESKLLIIIDKLQAQLAETRKVNELFLSDQVPFDDRLAQVREEVVKKCMKLCLEGVSSWKYGHLGINAALVKIVEHFCIESPIPTPILTCFNCGGSGEVWKGAADGSGYWTACDCTENRQ